MNDPKRTLPILTEKVQLDGVYKGWHFTMRTNIPFGKFCDAIVDLENTPNEEVLKVKDKLYKLLRMMVIKWNFVDEIGKPIPCTLAGFNLVPFDLINLTVLQARSLIETLPKVNNGA